MLVAENFPVSLIGKASMKIFLSTWNLYGLLKTDSEDYFVNIFNYLFCPQNFGGKFRFTGPSYNDKLLVETQKLCQKSSVWQPVVPF